MKKLNINKFYLSVLFYLLISVLSFVAIDYLVQINLDNINLIVLKNNSMSDIANLDSQIVKLNKQLKQLKQEASAAKSYSYPTLNDIKQISKRYSLSVANINKTKELDHNKTRYTISFQGSIYNIVRFLQSFESTYISDIEQLILLPNDLSGEKLKLQISVLLKS